MGNKFKIWWDEKEGIGRGVAYGEWDEETTKKMCGEYLAVAKQHGRKSDWLINLSKLRRISAAGRRILSETTGNPIIGKNAFVGAPIYIRVLSNFLLDASGKKDAKHFKNEKEALKWIKKSQKK